MSAPAASDAPAAPGRGRPRSAAVDDAIRDATLALLAEVGYAHLTTSAVATRAGVSTATLYRRWSSKLDLVVATLAGHASEQPAPDTGSLLGDFRAVLRPLVDAREKTGRILPGLVGEIGRNPELAGALRAALVAPRRRVLAAMLERAEARGELRPGVDRDVVIDLLVGPIQYRLLVTGQPVTRKIADEFAALAARAVAPLDHTDSIEGASP
ncbi:MAG TPA: TetR/AcrR family transcriptional regulator [Acidimicrobiales bacterium]|nr:TetR/AcrR family transcriptional regulator [Acidimicrobiales bacterium]